MPSLVSETKDFLGISEDLYVCIQIQIKKKELLENKGQWRKMSVSPSAANIPTYNTYPQVLSGLTNKTYRFFSLLLAIAAYLK